MKIKKVDTVDPICPFCEKALPEIWRKDADPKVFTTEHRYVYFCPHCRKVLGIAQQLK